MIIKKFIPQNLKNIYHLAQAILANLWFGFPASPTRFAESRRAGRPSKKIKVIGITGTNGKTTTAQMIAKILEEAGHSVAMISTINFKLGKKEWVNKTKFTTLSSWATQKFIKQAVNAGCEYLILETSSHSLDQNRIWGVNYDTAVITNITREHLDYHKTMKKYRHAKLALFKKAKNIVVNLDMEKPSDFLSFSNDKKYAYSIKYDVSSIKYQEIKEKIGDVKLTVAKDVKLGMDSSSYIIHNTKYIIHFPGKFNIENALAAVCVGLAEGINLETSAKALEKIKGIPGRMENVRNNKGLNIIIDYAVTPDSLEKLYGLISEMKNKCHSRLDRESRMKSLVSEITLDSRFRGNDTDRGSNNNKRTIAVLGACGERDRGKRPIMGEIVSRYADYIIITNEDPYGEDPTQITNELESGIKNHELGKTYFKILDRREAIKKALQIAKPGDFIIITGKGAEETMAIGNKRISWNDKKVILEVLREI